VFAKFTNAIDGSITQSRRDGRVVSLLLKRNE
jgi:hypothetical protein